MSTTYWRAPEVERIADKLIPAYHDHLSRQDVTIRCVFRDPPAKARGKIALGKARKIGGLNAHLVGLDRTFGDGDEPVDFFVIEIAHAPWEKLTDAQRMALVDHELSHFDVYIPDDPDHDRKLLVVGHDLEEFTDVVRRHGLWRPDVRAFAEVVGAQLRLPLEDA